MVLNFDLLGDPIPENHGRRGRPPHIPTDRNRSQVRLLVALGWQPPAIAAALRITKPTLRKHYFSELRHVDEARYQLKAAQMMMLYREADKGNVGAIKELGRIISSHELQAARTPEPKAVKVGKKEQRRQAAQQVPADWETLVH